MMSTNVIQTVLYVSSNITASGSFWEIFSLTFFLTLFFTKLLVLTFFLYLAGLVVVGKKRDLLSASFMISLFGTVLSTLFLMFIPSALLKLFLFIFVWLLLIKRFYETGWLGTTAVAILTVAISLAITIILGRVFQIVEEVFRLYYPRLLLLF